MGLKFNKVILASNAIITAKWGQLSEVGWQKYESMLFLKMLSV